MLLNLFNKKAKKIFEFQKYDLAVLLKNGWMEYVEEDKGNYGQPLSFFKEIGGVGVLQISLITSDEKKKVDVNKMLEPYSYEKLKVKKYKNKDWIIYEVDKQESDKFFRIFHLVKPSVIVYVTYNCGLKFIEKNKELNELKEIINSIELISKN